MKSATEPAKAQTSAPARQLRIVRGIIAAAIRVLLSGIEGVGKTTFAKNSQKPIFICVESGTNQIDAERYQFADDGRTEPQSWDEVQAALRDLATLPHEYETVVLDTADALEPLIWKHICERDKMSNIEEYGYGKGYVAALSEWRQLLALLERLRRERGMHVILIAHTHIKKFENPEGDNYDRHELKLNIKAGGLLKEWCDDVLFAHYETYAVKGEKEKKAKGISTGARVIETVRTAAWDAKNRHSLPATLPLSYADFAAALERRQVAPPADLKLGIAAKLEQFDSTELSVKVLAAVLDAKDDAEQLAAIDNRLTALIAERTKGA